MGVCLSRPHPDCAPPAADMTNPLRLYVSKQRKRFVAEGYDLDLSYITHNLIAMGFPSSKLEGMYRNRIDDVVSFLETKHRAHYKIYNLCSERSYNPDKFQGMVAAYPFNDHNPPDIDLVQRFCEDVHAWLTADDKNVAVVHCKAGKGRTGTMICCYLLYSAKFLTAAESLKYYDNERTHDSRGVTIPSQRRYVEYYADLLNTSRRRGITCLNLYKPPALLINEFVMQPPPILNGGQGSIEFYISVDKQSAQKVTMGSRETWKGCPFISMRPDRCTPLVGDVKIEVFNQKQKIKIVKDRLFHFWFNTFFVLHEMNATREKTADSTLYTLKFDKWQLDDAHKDKQNKLFTPDFMVKLVVQCVPENSVWGARATSVACTSPLPSPPSPSSNGADDDDTDDDDHEEGWESAVDGAAGGGGGPGGARSGGGGALLGHYRVLSESELDDIPDGAPNTITAPSSQQPDVERMLHA